MTPTAEALSAQAAQLPPAERMQVVERILDSLDQPDAALDTLWAHEANDRLAAYRRGIFPWYSRGEPILWWRSKAKTSIRQCDGCSPTSERMSPASFRAVRC